METIWIFSNVLKLCVWSEQLTEYNNILENMGLFCSVISFKFVVYAIVCALNWQITFVPIFNVRNTN